MSRLLDEVLDLHGEARSAYVADLRARDEALADDLASFVRTHAALEQERFLAGASPDAGSLAGASGAVTCALEAAQPLGIGRLRVLERLGAGGMGIVYAAYDPELERAVAVKFVTVSHDRDGALAEAKALARLSHPNVVTVFDVGLDGDLVHIVMELVRGSTLREWAGGRPRAEILAAYLQAGEALAAAHAAGLVHRDFKPTNAIMGRDGRVRVVDFGLACAAAATGQTAARPVWGGTPGYMAPEQAAGGEITAAADQYSFAVALDEALRGAAEAPPVPGWITSVIDRGRASDPAARFASMRDLLRALARDPARVLRRRLGITALAVLVASAGAATHSGLSNLEPICQEGEARLAESWSPDEQAVAAEQLASLGGYGRDLAARLRAEVAAFAGRWSAEHRALCLARRQRSQSDVLLDRRAACLDRGRWALGSLADVVRGATASTAPAVAVALSALPDAAACGDLTALANDVEPPATRLRHLVDVLQRQVEEARMQIAAGRYLEARDGAGRTLTEARRLAYAPLLAEVLLVVGHASMMLPAGRAAAVAVLEEAVAVALAARAYPVAVEAWARGRWTRATSDGDPAALDGLAVMEGLARGLPSAPFVRALLHNNVGSAWLALQRQEPARQAFERALREADGYRGPGAVELVNIRGNLALITTDAARRDQLFAAAEAELGRLLGNDHPQTLEMRWSRGRRTASAATAEALLEPACRGFERHADAGDRAAECWLEVAFLRSERGAPDGARDAVHRAEAAASRESPQWLDACAQRLVMDGRAREAAHSFTALLAGGPAPEARRWWEAARTAEHELGHGRALLALGDLAGARRALMASARQLEAIVERHPGWSALERRLGRAQAELAKTLERLGRPAGTTAASAAIWLRRTGGAPAEIESLERLSRRS